MSLASRTQPKADAEVERLRSELADARAELRAVHAQLELSMARANRLVVKSEVDAIEMAQLLNVSSDAMWVVDRDFRVRRVNDGLLQLLGRTSAEVLGRRCFDVLTYTACQTKDCPLARLGAEDAPPRLELDTESAQLDRHFIASASRYLGLDGEMLGVIMSFKDITVRKREEAVLRASHRNLEQLAVLDGLTQIANRRRFDEALRTEWLRAARERTALSLILCDVDHFKKYNDTCGHRAGDDVLVRVAGAMRAVVKRPADLVARYGGEEFVVILPATRAEGALKVAEHLRAAVEALAIPHAASPTAAHVTMSLGVATLEPVPGSAPGPLVESADRALYEAKHAGRNRCSAAKGA